MNIQSPHHGSMTNWVASVALARQDRHTCHHRTPCPLAMLFDALLILFPLFLGYLIPLSSPPLLKLINQLLGKLVYLILALMGVGLANVEGLFAQLATLGRISGTLLGCISVANLLALWWLDQRRRHTHSVTSLPAPSKWRMMAESMKLALVVIAGFALGSQFAAVRALPVDRFSEWALMLLLLLIGIQMRNFGMSLRQILLNRWGLQIALCVLLSSWAGALVASLLLPLSATQALALASSFGWYSLSGILVADKLGPLMGSAAFLNDLGRELLAILLIPVLMRRHPSSAIGYSGATALDFTLPVIQRSGGVDVVPIAVVSGFVLSLLGPILVLGFLAWPS
ncbi:Uncharacterized membrane protein YbjE, DUF340 family [Aeromonas sp. RU39B]|nr:Uncharacterized membrane protein YbjE, DUF340 family [Aeromonas sp. RU39B]